MALAQAAANPWGDTSTTLPLVLTSGSDLKADDLKATCKLWQDNIDEWRMLYATYDGVRALVEGQAIVKHERESQQNFERRMKELYGFGYTKSVVDLLTFYLFKREVTRDMGALNDYEDWTNFTDDCDLEGQAFAEFLTEQARYASIYGHIGILVDKPNYKGQVRADELKNGIYPYVAAYHPPAILDWKYQRDVSGRPRLAFLKLKDDEGLYRLWWQDKWEVWREPDGSKEEEGIRREGGAVLVAEGNNTLGEIPFVWLYNLKKLKGLGFSDVHDIARIDISIIRNLSQGEEVINYGAFPMLLAPMLGDQEVTQSDEVGATAVQEFNPENPEGTKPEWLESKVGEPISAILEWIQRKVEEIYRAANAGGAEATENARSASSGIALSIKHQLLNSKLAQKAVNLEKAEKSIVWCWLKWQDMEKAYDKIRIERPRTYDVQNLAEDLENILTSMAICHSELFQKAMEKAVARRMLPSATEDQLGKIDTEIDTRPWYAVTPRRAVEIDWEEDLELDRKKKQAEIDQKEKQAKEPRDTGTAPMPFGGSNSTQPTQPPSQSRVQPQPPSANRER